MAILKATAIGEYNTFEASINVVVEKAYEQILIIGTEQHPATDNVVRNVAISTGLASLPVNSKMKFVMQALRKVILNKDQRWTIMLCVQGYTDKQLKKIEDTFLGIKDDDEQQVVKHILKVASPATIVKYINDGIHKGTNVSTPRNKTKIRRLGVYSHGIVGQFALWMGLYKDEQPFSTAYAKDLKPDVFAENDTKIYSYACRTGIGNPEISASVFYEQKTGWFWSNKTKRRHDEMFDKSLAQVLADSTKGTVYAYLKRSDYAETFNTSDELDFLDACYARINNANPDRSVNKLADDKKGYRRIIDNGMTDVDKKKFEELKAVKEQRISIDGATFDPSGALHPVICGTTPEGLRNGMWTFTPKTK